MLDERGILSPCKAKNRRNAGCITRFFNAAGSRRRSMPVNTGSKVAIEQSITGRG